MLSLLVLAFVTLFPTPSHAGDAHKNTFRLGSAALPFGWATAVADFDADHKPDFAIANKIGTSTRGYEYSLEFELSLETRQVFHFHSSYSGLSVAAIDLDNDQDLDVVLTRVSNGEIVGVWINNGHGEFSEGLKDNIPSIQVVRSEQALHSKSYHPTLAATLLSRSLWTVPRRRSGARLPLRIRAVPATVQAPCGRDVQHCLSPRAPPTTDKP